MTPIRTTLGRITVAIGGTFVIVAIAIVVFVEIPETMTQLLGMLIVLLVGVGSLRFFSSTARSIFPEYNVAEVSVEGPITRWGSKPIPGQRVGTRSDDIVDLIENANGDSNVNGLLLKLNTPGGQIIPSDDIRDAVERFDGPAVAYVTDVCGSGGYLIASGCDEIIARDASLVGSIGVLGSRVNATDLAEKVGLSYERFAAGKFKDTGIPLRDMDEDERAYLQGLINDFYDKFVERVSIGRGLQTDTIRHTDARVYLGEKAAELELIDALGSRDDAIDRLEELADLDKVVVQSFDPERGIIERMGVGVEAVAYAFGVGVASIFIDDDTPIDVRA